MKRILSGLALLLSLSAATSASSYQQPLTNRTTHTTEMVYVCMSKGSVAYHSSSDCAGLNRCTHEVKTMSAAQATQIGKRACQKCY
jgi:glycerate kinase